jgi:hypothetical protein
MAIMSVPLRLVSKYMAPSPNAPFAIAADPARDFYAVQFHPEVHHTPKGAKLYENFIRLAGFTGDWTMGAYREQALQAIRDQVGDQKVICGLSGGVDSSVAAVLIHEAYWGPAHLRFCRPRLAAPERGLKK